MPKFLAIAVLACCATTARADVFHLFSHCHLSGSAVDCDSTPCDELGCDRCEKLCDWDSCTKRPCCPQPIVPTMIGDSGLLVPRLEIGAAGLQPIFQNHIYKVAENNSAVPQDRIGFNFNYLPDVYNGTIDSAIVKDDLYEYRFFVEKTLFGDRFSVDFMIPFYSTSDYNPGDAVNITGPQTDTAFGDLAFGFKYLIYRSNRSALSAGLRVEAPTNDEIDQPGSLTQYYNSIPDDVWHFTPYAGLLLTPSDRSFVQSFVSYRMNTGPFHRELPLVPIREQGVFMADLAAGYWIYRNPRNRGVTGIIPTLELHYAGAYEEESPANTINTVNNLYIGKWDVLNLTAGMTALVNNRLSMSFGIAAPLRDNPVALPVAGNATVDTDRRYDWAMLFNVNYFFGR